MGVRVWAREVGATDSHSFELLTDTVGKPACDSGESVSNLEKSVAKPFCRECVEIVGAPSKSE